MVATVVTLLEKADTVYNQLNAHKPHLEALLQKVLVERRMYFVLVRLRKVMS